MIAQWLRDWKIPKRNLHTLMLVRHFVDKKVIEKLARLCDGYGFQVKVTRDDEYLY